MSKLIIKEKYATVPNDLLNSKDLSLKAKGLFAFLQCKPGDWKFSTERISAHLLESERVIRKTLQELEHFGLLERKRLPKDSQGKWTGYDYILTSIISKDISPKPYLRKVIVRNNDNTDNGEDISKQDSSKKDIVNNSYNTVEPSSTTETEVISNLLEDKNKFIQIIGLYAIGKEVKFNSKKQQQDFIKRNIRASKLLDSYELDRVKDVMRYLINNASFKWTLESVSKYIDEDLNNLKSNNNIVIIK